ncbi:MAG TPA: hypothetical protein VHZ32_12110, partial [Rhizomicrobium sp.]|nr:hypothetical protein [Rhizomicrobium sp.]
GPCPLLAGAFGKAGRGEDILHTLAIFLHVLGKGSRHPLSVGHPGCIGLTADEAQMLALLAAVQARHKALFAAHLCWLVRPECQDAVTIAARVLARLLSLARIRLPPPAPMAAPNSSALCRVTGPILLAAE